MKTMTSETTVGEIVRAVPARSRIFENLGIDYCCGGKKPLAEACRAKGLDPATVVAMLTALDGVPTTTTINSDAMSLSELCDHIEEFHHGYLREELPRLDFMTRKVAVRMKRFFPLSAGWNQKTETSLRLPQISRPRLTSLDPSTKTPGLRWRGSRN